MSVRRYRGLTWDHRRGYNALAAAAAALDAERDGLAIDWDRHPLEGFESHPIADLCARYDLVVLDHPHVGEAVRDRCLQPLEAVFSDDTIAEIAGATIGPCLSSYRYGGKHWALPLDAATQVMAARADLIGDALPQTWEDVHALSRNTGRAALSLSGPHAILSLLSIATALGEPPAEQDPETLVSRETGAEAMALLAELAALSPASVAHKNPIGILEHMAKHDDVVLCPLIYGYVNYAAPAAGHAIAVVNAPRHVSGGRPGSTLGGTGIGISARCAVTPELKKHLLWLMSDEAQRTFIPKHHGQPSRRAVWHDPAVNRRWANFYIDTAATIEAAYVRPRHAGWIGFQEDASASLRAALADRRPARATIDDLQTLYARSRAAGAER